MIAHIVFSDSAAGQVKQLLSQNKDLAGQIFSFRDDLSSGPLHSKDFKNGRMNWYRKILQHSEYDPVEESLSYFVHAEIEEHLKAYLTQENAQICFWVGANACEELGFLRVISSLPFLENTFLIQIPRITNVGLNGETYDIHNVGECSIDAFSKILVYKKIILKQDFELYKRKWDEISRIDSLLRVRKDIFSYRYEDVTYFDDKILGLCSKEFVSSSKIVGTFLHLFPSAVSLDFIVWRMRELIKEGKLLYEGKLINMREFILKLA